MTEPKKPPYGPLPLAPGLTPAFDVRACSLLLSAFAASFALLDISLSLKLFTYDV